MSFTGEGRYRKSEFDVEQEHNAELKEFQKMAGSLFEHGRFYLSTEEEYLVKNVRAHFRKVVIFLNIGRAINNMDIWQIHLQHILKIIHHLIFFINLTIMYPIMKASM